MKAIPSLRAFSLTELLLGIAVVAIVAAVIVPKFLSIQSQANATVAQQMAAELNNTYGSWKAAGGVLTGPTANAGPIILSVLGGYNDVGSQPVSVSGGSSATGGVVTASDPVGNATLIRAALPASTTIDLSNPTDVIPAGDFTIVYDSDSDAFQVFAANLNSLPWQTDSPMTLNNSTFNRPFYSLCCWIIPPPSVFTVGQTYTIYFYDPYYAVPSIGRFIITSYGTNPQKPNYYVTEESEAHAYLVPTD